MGFLHQGKLFVHALWVVHIGNGSREILFPRQEDVFGATGEVGFVLFGEGGDGKGVPTEGVGVAIIGFKFSADGGNPDEVKAGGDDCHVPKWSIVEGEGLVRKYYAMIQKSDGQILSFF